MPRGEGSIGRPGASWIGAAISLVALAAVGWWVARQDAPHLPDSGSGIAWLVLALAVIAGNFCLRALRWHLILNAAGIAHRRRDALGLLLVGYMGNTVLPARGGEVLRILLMGRRSTAKRRVILGGLGVALQVYLVLRRRGRLERFAATVRPVAQASKPLLGKWGAALCGVTLGVWIIEGLIFWLVAQSLELQVSILEGLFLLVLTAFFSLIPAAPGYVGTFDAAVVFGLHALSVDGGQALAYALLVRFVLFVPITVAGLVLLVTRYGGLRQLRRGVQE